MRLSSHALPDGKQGAPRGNMQRVGRVPPADQQSIAFAHFRHIIITTIRARNAIGKLM
jgi:hypothetical protein